MKKRIRLSAGSRIPTLAGCGMMLLAIGSVMAYLWGDLLITEFQADICDTLLWADAAYRSGSLLSPEFYYPYIIPFGGQLLMLPFIPAFGVSLTTLRLGMTLYFALFAAVLVFFFYAVVFRSAAPSLISSGCIIMLLENNKKLREVMYAHVIHYSLAIIFILLLFTFFALYLPCVNGGGETRKKRNIYLALLGVTAFFCAADGTAIIALAFVPFAGGCIAERFIETVIRKNDYPRAEKKRELAALCVTAAAAAAGFVTYCVLKTGMHTHYEKQFFALETPAAWFYNFKHLILYWVRWLMSPSLYADTLPLSTELSAAGKVFELTQMGFMLGGALLFLTLTFACWKRLDRSGRITVLSAWAEWAITSVLFIFTPVGNQIWRMIPMLVMVLIGLAVLIRAAFSGKGVIRAAAAAAAAAAVLLSANAGLGVICAETDTDIWFGEGTFISALKEHDLHYGYCTLDTFCQVAGVLTDGDIRLCEITGSDGIYHPALYQNNISDYVPPDGCERFFILRPAGGDPTYAADALEIISGKTYISSWVRERDKVINYEILVFDHVPVDEHMVEVFSDNT